MAKLRAVTWAKRHEACDEAIEWLETLPKSATMVEAWRRCKRPDWMLWALDECRHRKKHDTALRLFAVSCARRSLLAERKAGREPDKRSWDALRIARLYAEGNAGVGALSVTLDDAWYASFAIAVESSRSAARAAAGACALNADIAADRASSAASSVAGYATGESFWSDATAAANSAAMVLQANSLRRLIPEWSA